MHIKFTENPFGKKLFDAFFFKTENYGSNFYRVENETTVFC